MPNSNKPGFPSPSGRAVTLDDLGPRVVLMGPSNAGKSTLARAIGRARKMPVVHLDLLHHRPGTDWVPRAPDAFVRLHDAAIQQDRWVMEGNYTPSLPQRLARASGLILLDVPTRVSLWRYVRRCWFESDRAGALEGGRDSVRWSMLHHIAVATRASRRRHTALLADLDIPCIALPSPDAIAEFYRREGLGR